jgi:hypothetical protein
MKNEIQQTVIKVDVLIVYDNVGAVKRTKELCDRLAQRFASQCEFHLNFWSIAALQSPAYARVATDEVTHAALLIVAVNGDEALPPPIKSCISRCACRMRADGGALVVQLHGILKMDKELSPAHGCLKRIAEESGVDFFSEVIELEEAELDGTLTAIHQRAQMRTPVLEGVLQYS